MGRRYEGVLDEWEEYVPDVWGERELFKVQPDEAIVMEIRYLTRAELKQHIATKNKFENGKISSVTFEQRARELIDKNVRNIKNCDSPDDGKPILTGGDLFDRGELPMIEDVSTAIITRSYLSEGMTKNLRSRCDSPT